MGNFFNLQGKRKLEGDDNQEIRELKKMLAEKDVQLAEKDVQLAEKDNTIYDKSVRKLFECGIPKKAFLLSFGSTEKTSYTSKHEPAEFVLKSFQTIEDLQTKVDSIVADSFTLVRSKDRRVYKYSTEADIGTFVREVLEDTAVLSGLPDIQIFGKKAVLHLSNIRRPDFLVIESKGRPFSLVKVKSPACAVFEDAHVYGQAYNYLLMVRSFYGQVDLFIIVTTMDGWHICWLPDCDECAASSSRERQQTHTSIPDGKRVIHGSRVFKHDDKELIPSLVSAFIKGYYGRYGSVSMMSISRQYICAESDKWNWSKLPQNFSLTEPLKIGVPVNTSSVLMVRYFAMGGDGQVILGLNCSERLLHVVKLYHPKEDSSQQSPRDLEHKLWEQIWGVNTSKCRLAGCDALIMPLVFCATGLSDKEFFLSRSDWLYNSGIIGDTDDADLQAMDKIEQQVKACYNEHPWSVDEAEAEAKATMKAAGYAHADMKLEHIALMPRFDESGDIVALQPILIDLARVETLSISSSNS